MKRFVLFVTLPLVLIAGTALADPAPRMQSYVPALEQAQASGMAKALLDTVYMIGNPRNPDQWDTGGNPPQANGTFQDQFGTPGWYGWTHSDLTFSNDEFWNVSDFMVINGNWSMWCGTYFGSMPADPGYGDNWFQNLVYTYQVADDQAPSVVTWQGVLQYDSEAGWDYTILQVNLGGVWSALDSYSGTGTVNFDQRISYAVSDYVGSADNEIQLRFRFESDGNTSDGDGGLNTDGACQIDDVRVAVDNGGLDVTEDFEAGPGGTYDWVQVLDPGVGDYAALYVGLLDEDICVNNFTAQVAFVDDGVVVPGTGGSPCQTWCYGPGGFIVNNTGGLMGPDFHIHNAIDSPYLEWPAGADAAYVEFGVYRHEELGAPATWPGMFYEWFVRSTASGDPADLETAAYGNRNFVQYGGPNYVRQNDIVTDIMVPGRTHCQMRLTVFELGYNWGWVGTDGTPAPYFDNVQFVAYPFAGPGIATRDIDIFQDNFPAIDHLDFANLANNAVRLDMANNVALPDDMVNYPGDSIFFDVTAVRAGSVLDEMPRMNVAMKANPLFDGVRVLPAGFTQTGDLVEGWVYSDSTYSANGNVVPDRYTFDLPDDDFFFPGDVLHYYIEARDDLGGTTYFPSTDAGPPAGFTEFGPSLVYPLNYEVRALPTMFSATAGDQPAVIFWQDAIDRGGMNEWWFALHQLGYQQGVDYDMYATNGPSSGVGNGLGSRATSVQLDGYSTMLYTAGALSVNLLANGDFDNDPSNDLAVVTNWFGNGDKNAFMTGDDLVTGLLDAGSQGSAFVNTYFNVNYVQKSVLELIGSQTTPVANIIDGNGIISSRANEWICYGGCPGINSFDAIEANAGALRVAEFLDPDGNPGTYPYAAAVYNNYAPENASVVMMPVDLMYVYNVPGWVASGLQAGFAVRTIILEDILLGFGEAGSSAPIGVTPDAVFAVSNFPNPFNPATTIEMTIPRAGDVSLKVFNVRGELVRTLVNGHMEAGTYTRVWDGKSDQGNQAASGVYFYETRAGGEVKVNKMALVK